MVRSLATSANAWSPAIKEYQKINGAKPTGVLNPQERAVLAETARRQENVGWRIVTGVGTGAGPWHSDQARAAADH